MMMLVQAATGYEESEEDGLIRAAAAGDRAAFGDLYSRYARMVHGILLAEIRNILEEFADELGQR